MTTLDEEIGRPGLFEKTDVVMKVENKLVVVANDQPLVLWMDPQAIREHFSNSYLIDHLSDAELAEVAIEVLQSDSFYETWNREMREQFKALHDFDPDAEDEDEEDEEEDEDDDDE